MPMPSLAVLVGTLVLLLCIAVVVIAAAVLKYRTDGDKTLADEEAAAAAAARISGDSQLVSGIELIVLDETLQVTNLGETSIRLECFGLDCCALLYMHDVWTRKFDPRSACSLLLYSLQTRAMIEELMFEVRVSGGDVSVRPGDPQLKLQYCIHKLKASMYLHKEKILEYKIFTGQLLKTVNFNRAPGRYYKICAATKCPTATKAASVAAAARSSLISGSNTGRVSVDLSSAAAVAAVRAAAASCIEFDDVDAIENYLQPQQHQRLQLQIQEQQQLMTQDLDLLPLMSMRVEPNKTAAMNATNRVVKAVIVQPNQAGQLNRLLMNNMMDMPSNGTFTYQIRSNRLTEFQDLLRLRLSDQSIAIDPTKRFGSMQLYCEIDLIGRKNQPVAKKRIITAEILSELQLPRRQYSYLLTFSVPVADQRDFDHDDADSVSCTFD